MPLKCLAFNLLTTPDKDSGLSCLQSACIDGDVETVSAILNHSPDKLDSAIALSLKIGHNATNLKGRSIHAVLRQQVSKEHKQISEFVEKVAKHFQSQSLLHLAAKKGQVEHLQRLLDCGEPVDSPSPELCGVRETPLMLAARFNEWDAVEFLAERGASLELQDAKGCTALHHSAMAGKIRNILRLIELGANVSKVNHEQNSAIHLAAENGHTEAVRLLLEHGADAKQGNWFGVTPLMLAAQNGHLQMIDLLLKNGGNLSDSDENCMMPLHYAATEGQIDVVKYILEKHGNVLTTTVQRDTLLHFATRLELVQSLFEQGADIHATNSYGGTPLQAAAVNGQSDTISYLINQGADVNARDASGWSALYFALNAGHTAAVKVLIESGCDLKLVDSDDGYLPNPGLLQVAAERGLTDVLQLLLDRGLSEAVDRVNTHGETPVMRAVRAGRCDTVEFLLEHGANINGTDNVTKITGTKDSWVHHRDSDYEDSDEDEYKHTRVNRKQNMSPLYCALEAGQSEVAKLLIKRGADTSNSDTKSNTLAEVAAKYCSLDVVQLLSDNKEISFGKLEDGQTLLISAICRQDFDSIPLLLEKGVDVNERNTPGDTALCCLLQFAPRSRAMEIAKLFLTHGADINTTNSRFQTPLQIACFRNYSKVAELLLDHGGEANVKNDHSLSPLHYATKNNNGKLVEMLLQYGADASIKGGEEETTPLHVAAATNSVHAAQELLKHGVDVEVTNKLGRASLAEAAARGSLPMVQLLLKQGSSVHSKDVKQGQTPIILAVERFRHKDPDNVIKHTVVKTLLDHGSSVNVTDEFGRSPLHCVEYTTRECCDLLLQYGADVNLPDVNKETPLHFAASAGNTDCIEWLLQQGANVEALDNKHRTPLHAASYGGDRRSLELLIQHEADVHLADKKGWLPLHVAAAGGHFNAAEVLFQNGSDMNAADNKGRTVLHLAMRSACRELIEFLILHGSNLNATDFSGHTILGAATNEWHIFGYLKWNVLEAYIENGGDKHAVDAVTGRTALHFAAALVVDGVATLDNLLNHGLDLNARDKNGDTPLHRAAARGTPEIVQRLVDRGANLSAVNNRGQTPFLVSLAVNSEEKSKILLKHGSNVQVADNNGTTALHFAVLQPSLVKMIIKEGIDVNAANVDGCTPLHRAAFFTFSSRVVRLLLKAGANVHCRDKNGNTPLHIAISRAKDEIASLLIENGSDVNAANVQGRMCLHMANVGTFGTVKKLFLHGAQVNAVDELGCTPLHLAMRANDCVYAKALLKHGSDPKAVDYKGSTPLHVGCCSNSIHAVSALIDHGW